MDRPCNDPEAATISARQPALEEAITVRKKVHE
jgi:hypothetical protein